MKNKKSFNAILESLPEKPCRSRLEPYSELIFELHRRGRTYREIARILDEYCNFRTSRSTINDFVRRWSTPTVKVVRPRMQSSQQNVRKSQTALVKMQMTKAETPMMEGDVQKRIAALKSRPIPRTETIIYHYDPEEPLHVPLPPSRKESGE